MGLAELIVKHAKLVVVLWIIILILLAPLAIKLNSVLSYEETAFLPQNTESSIADNILKEKFNESMLSMENTVLLLTGINATSNNTYKAYLDLKNKIENKYAKNILSYYDIYKNLTKASKNISSLIVTRIVNATLMYKNITHNLLSAYKGMINETKSLAYTIQFLRKLVYNTTIMYNMLKKNITMLYNLTHNIKNTLLLLDSKYVEFRNNITELYSLLRNINESLVQTNNLTYTIEQEYSKLYFDATRTYYYLSAATDAYSKGYVSERDVEIILYYTNLSSFGMVDPRLIYIVFNATYNICYNNTILINDLILSNITYNIVYNYLEEINNTYYKKLILGYLNIYHNIFYNELLSNETTDYRRILDTYTLNESMAGPVQNKVFYMILTIANNAVNKSGTKLADIIFEYIKRVNPNITKYIAQLIVNKSISLGPTPTPKAVKNATISLIFQIMKMHGGINTKQYEWLLDKLYSIKVLNSSIIGLFYKDTVMNLVPIHSVYEEEILKECLDQVLSIDKNITGILIKNSTVLENTTISIVYKFLTMYSGGNLNIFMPLIKQLYVLNKMNNSIINNITKNTLFRIYIEYFNKTNITIQGFEINRKIFVLIINKTINYAQNINPYNESEIYNAVHKLLIDLIPENMSIIINKIYNEIYGLENFSENYIRIYIVNKLFPSLILETINKTMFLNNTNIPENMKPRIYGEVKSYIGWMIKHYPLSEKLIEKYVIKKISNIMSNYTRNNPYMNKMLKDLNITYIVSLAYSIGSSNVSVIKEYVESRILRALLDEMHVYLDMFKSNDNSTIVIIFKPLGSSDHEKYDNALKIRDLALDIFSKYYPGCKGYVTGGSVSKEEMKEVGMRDVNRVQVYSYLFTLLMLFIVVEAVFAVLVPFISIGAAIMLASGIVYIIASRFMTISNWATVLMTTTSLGLGIDYSTYFMHRLREFIGKGLDFDNAVIEAIRHARDGILASASTDIIGFAVLMIAWDFPFLRVIGVTVPLAIFSVFLASLTLIPALITLIGKKKAFWWPKIPKRLSKHELLRESKVVNAMIKYRGVVIALFIILSIPATYAFIGFHGSHNIDLYLPEGTQVAQAYKLMEEKIGASITSPLYAILVFNNNITDNQLVLIENISAEINSLKHVKEVYGPTRPFGKVLENITYQYIKMFNGTIYIAKDNKTVILRIILDKPAESDEARNCVRKIRDILSRYIGKDGLSKAYVGGVSAALVDLDDLLTSNFWHKIIPISIILMFIALMFSLRGVIAAAITLSIIYVGTTWSIWIASILFSNVFNKPLLWFLPLVLLVVLLGVGVDYNSFYLVKVRDEMKSMDTRKALSISARSSGKLIIGLALILVSAYVSLMFTSMWAMREMGFVLTLGILIIAVSAVYILSPAIISITKHYSWWPFRRRRKSGEFKE